MTETERERWDGRHASAGPVPAPVDPFVTLGLEQLGPGAGRRALDLASGTGRHALELARRGWLVEAWDLSPVGLAILEQRAATADLELGTRAVDLCGPELSLSAASWDLVVLVNFLERPLLPRLVRPGGHVLFATFTVDREGTRPPLEFCLERGELGRGLEGFETLATHETGGRSGLLGRRS